MTTEAMPATGITQAPRVARLSYFFPAHNEEANLEGLVDEALETLPPLAETFEIIAVDDGSRDATPAIADDLAARHPGVVRVVHHPTNLGYGARASLGLRGGPLRARGLHRRRPPVPGRRHRPARPRACPRPTRPTSSSASGSSAPTRSSGPLYARAYRLANRIFFGLKVTRRRLRLQALPARGARGRPRRIGRRVLLGRAADQAPGGGPHDRRGRRAALPADGRLARPAPSRRSSAAVRDFWRLRLRMWVNRARSLPPRRHASSATDGGQLVAAGSSPPGRSDVERVDEVAEDVEPRVDQPLAGRLERRHPGARPPRRRTRRRPRGRPARAPPSDGEDPAPRRGPPARARRTAARRPRPSAPTPARTRRAWNVSSARSEMTTRSTRTPRSSRVVDEQVVGQRALRRSGPGASSRSRSPPTGRSRSGGSGRARSP